MGQVEWGTDTLTMPRELPGDLLDKIRDTMRYYLRCAFDGATEFPTLKPEEWDLGATLSVWRNIVQYLEGSDGN